MKKFKKTLCIVLSMLMLLGALTIAPITANAGMPTYFHPGIVTESGYWYAWTWDNGGDGSWRTAYDEDGVLTFYGLSKNVVFVLMDRQLDEPDDLSWGYTIHQSDNQEVTDTHFTATKWTDVNKDWETLNFSGVWSDKEESVKEEPAKEEPAKAENTLSVTTATKTVKASDLKKSAKTIKPLTITKQRGNVKVAKVSSGSSSAIYSKASVNEKTGAVTLKKGSYSAGTYKLVLKVTASGDANYSEKSVTKTAKIIIQGKDENTVKVSTKSKDLKSGKLAGKKTTVKLVTVKNAKGKVKIVKVKSGTTKSLYKKIKVNKKTGKITFKKGSYKKGNYKIKLKVTAAGNDSYKSKSVTVTVKLRIAKKYKKCSDCSGKGYKSCTACSGKGFVYTGVTLTLYSYGYAYRTIRLTRSCSTCGGDGKIDCGHCHGHKTIMK